MVVQRERRGAKETKAALAHIGTKKPPTNTAARKSTPTNTLKGAKPPANASFERALALAAAAAALLVALLVASAHAIKSARRAERRRIKERLAQGLPPVEDDARPVYTVSERAIIGATVAALLLSVVALLAYIYGERFILKWRAHREARLAWIAKQAERVERLKQTAERKHHHKLSAQQAEARAEAEARERALFEATTLAGMRAAETAREERLRLEAEARKREDSEAFERARELDRRFEAEAAAGAATKGATGADWHSYVEAEAEWEAEGSAGEESEGEGEGELSGPRMEVELQPTCRGTQVVLDSMGLPPLCVARLCEVWALLSCTRCSEVTEVQLSGLSAAEADRRAWCAKCAAMLGARLRPCLLHAGDTPQNIAGHIDTVSCSVADVTRVDLLLQCACGGERSVGEVPRGRRVRDSCHACHKPLYAYFENMSLVKLAGASGGKVRAAADDEEDEMQQLLKKIRRKNADQLRLAGIVPGMPLPQKGGCRHFKQSHRWLRFPCCGRAWPCAVCHELSDCPMAAEGVWATRMLCGKCSRESAYSDRPCEHCGNAYVRKGGAHWHGGDGCRDQQRLSSKDSHKHKGVKKTTSAKSQRVGVQGKIKTAASKRVHVS